MQLTTFVLAALTAAMPALAFTNGTLVPAYMCNRHPDGLPKNYGQLLSFTREMTGPIAFNANASDNLAPAPMAPQKNGTLTGNSAYILASFHNTLNSLKAIPQGLIVSTLNGGPLVAGSANQLNLSVPNPNFALDGAMLYGETTPGTRVGSFTDKGGMGTFVDFPGCGKNREGQMAGVIHQMLVSCNSTYTELFYNVPACVPGGNITLAGLSVTDMGFGVWQYSFAVTGSKCDAHKKFDRAHFVS